MVGRRGVSLHSHPQTDCWRAIIQSNQHTHEQLVGQAWREGPLKPWGGAGIAQLSCSEGGDPFPVQYNRSPKPHKIALGAGCLPRGGGFPPAPPSPALAQGSLRPSRAPESAQFQGA